MTDHILVLHRRIPSQNVRDRWHWRRRHQDRQAWLYGLRYCCGLTTEAPTEPRSITICSYRAQAIKDHANLVGGCKGLIDAMVCLNLLRDDDDESMSVTYTQEKCKRVDERTVIYLHDFTNWTPAQPLRPYKPIASTRTRTRTRKPKGTS